MLQDCSRIWTSIQECFVILWEQRGYPISSSLYPRVECSCRVMLGRVCRWLETKASGEVWSSPSHTARHLSRIIVSLLIILSKTLHFGFLISSSLFCPFFKIQRTWSHICILIPMFICAEFAMQSRDNLWIQLRISILDCKQFVYSHLFAFCGFESKVPFMLLLSSRAPRRSVFFFPVVIQAHI